MHYQFIIAFSLIIISPSVKAATIAWSAATNVNATTDISTAGTLVRALNFGEATNRTINTVTFVGYTATYPGGTGSYDPVAGTGTIIGSASFTGYGTPVDHANAALDASYGSALASGRYVNGAGSIGTQTLTGLTIGQQYLIQIWFNDVRTTVAGDVINSVLIDSGASTPSVTLQSDDDGLDGAGGRGALAQFTIGTFTASATTQVFRVDENSTTSVAGATMNMLQIRAIPEPSSMWLGGLGVLALMRRRR